VRLGRQRREHESFKFDDAGFESRLVWIFGSPRSGSTWLLQLLVHPLVPTDESALGVECRDAPDGGAPQAIPINEPYIPQHLTPPLFQAGAVSEELAAVTLNSFRHASPNYLLSDHYADVWRPELRRLLLVRLEAQARQIAEKHSLSDPLVIVKEPNGSIGADFVMSLLPRARLIFLLRDGRDVVDSMLDALAPGSWLESRTDGRSRDVHGERLKLVRRESNLWLARTEAVQRAYDAHPPHLRRVVRYEEARTGAAGVLAGLDSWLGSRRGKEGRASAVRWNDFDSYPPEAKGPGMPLRAARPGLWRENLSRSERDAMNGVMGAKLADLGYRT
jgi:Sulfotransferase family